MTSQGQIRKELDVALCTAALQLGKRILNIYLNKKERIKVGK